MTIYDREYYRGSGSRHCNASAGRFGRRASQRGSDNSFNASSSTSDACA